MTERIYILWTDGPRGPQPQLLIRQDDEPLHLSSREKLYAIGSPIPVMVEYTGRSLRLAALHHPCPAVPSIARKRASAL